MSRLDNIVFGIVGTFSFGGGVVLQEIDKVIPYKESLLYRVGTDIGVGLVCAVVGVGATMMLRDAVFYEKGCAEDDFEGTRTYYTRDRRTGEIIDEFSCKMGPPDNR